MKNMHSFVTDHAFGVRVTSAVFTLVTRGRLFDVGVKISH